MKKNLLLVSMLLISIGMLAQEEKEVITGAGYANDVYYSLENGTITSVDRDNWDVAFITQVMSVSVLANNGSGVELYTYPDGTIDDWATLDTTGMDWTPMYNSLETFDMGAFNANTIPGDDFDYGWGRYNMSNHLITGDSLFVIKTVSGAYKKIAITEKNPMTNTWQLKYANLDGSDEQTETLEAANHISDYFYHYSLDSIRWLDREPGKDEWDLLFTKYYDYTIPYIVTGVLINDDHVVAQEVREPGMDQSTHNSFEETAFTSHISEIGSDWKQFNMGTMSYDLIDTVVYYLKTYGEADSTYYKIYFTGFTGGMTDGKYIFMQEEIWLTSAEDNEFTDPLLQVYPNPAADKIHVVFDLYGRTDIDIIDMTGRLVYSTAYEASGFTNLNLDLAELNPGVFFVRVSAENQSNVLRLIKE